MRRNTILHWGPIWRTRSQSKYRKEKKVVLWIWNEQTNKIKNRNKRIQKNIIMCARRRGENRSLIRAISQLLSDFFLITSLYTICFSLSSNLRILKKERRKKRWNRENELNFGTFQTNNSGYETMGNLDVMKRTMDHERKWNLMIHNDFSHTVVRFCLIRKKEKK